MDFWENFWSVIWWFVWVFAFTTYLIAVFWIITDIFRDHSLKRVAEGGMDDFLDLRSVLNGLDLSHCPRLRHD